MVKACSCMIYYPRGIFCGSEEESLEGEDGEREERLHYYGVVLILTFQIENSGNCGCWVKMLKL